MPFRKKREEPPVPPQPVSISHVTGSAVAVGTGNYTLHGSTMDGAGVPAATLEQAIAGLRAAIEARGGDLKPAALEQAKRMDQAANSQPPDATALAAAREWFLHHLPKLLPAVVEVAEHPSIDSALKAAGQVLGSAPDSQPRAE